MKKVYALHYNEQKLEMKISSEKHWEKQNEFVENNTKEDLICYWNSVVFLSFSRSALVKKANEIKVEWLKKRYEDITKIVNIQL